MVNLSVHMLVASRTTCLLSDLLLYQDDYTSYTFYVGIKSKLWYQSLSYVSLGFVLKVLLVSPEIVSPTGRLMKYVGVPYVVS